MPARPLRPSASSTTRPHPQDGRGPRGRGRHGLDGAGAGARHHDHLGRHRLRVAGPPHQHHRHSGPRRLHRRGRALAAGARRRDCAVRLRGGVEPQSRRSGARRTSTACRGSPTSTRWTARGPTSARLCGRCETASARTRCRSSCRSGPRATSRASWTWSHTGRWCGTTSSAPSGRSRRSPPT